MEHDLPDRGRVMPPTPERGAGSTGCDGRIPGVIDACVFHEWAGPDTLAGYMPEAWRQLLLRPGDRSGPVRFHSQWLYPNPLGSKDVRAGSDREILVDALAGERERVVLGYDDGLLSTAFPNYYVARTVVRAANDWTTQEWLTHDGLYGMVLVSSALPDDAAAEIRRAGAHDRMVAVQLGANVLGQVYGHPVYAPIHAAAAELGLPLVLHVGCDAAADLSGSVTGGGQPATYGEYRALSMHGQMSHVASMLVRGVFERHRGLQVLLVGGGAAWIAPWLWRIDGWYKANQQEAPWLRRLPSEYFADHVRIATYGLESPAEPSRLAQALGLIPNVERALLYSSCHPNADALSPTAAAQTLPHSWRTGMLRANALEFFRWPSADSQPGEEFHAGV